MKLIIRQRSHRANKQMERVNRCEPESRNQRMTESLFFSPIDVNAPQEAEVKWIDEAREACTMAVCAQCNEVSIFFQC